MTDVDVVLVTGAAQGLGFAIAKLLAQRGIRVVMVDRQAEHLREAAQHIEQAIAYPFDLLDVAGIDPLIERIEQECGKLTGLVNNAGIVKTQPFLEATSTDWDTIFGVNARAPFLLMQAVGKRMSERGAGAVVNIASVAGRSARPQQTLYGASKATLLHLTKSAASTFGPFGVRVNAICPGVVQTEMTEHIWRERQPEDVQQILRSIPLRRTAPPDEVAAAAVWLLSAEASYINGQALNVCGGLEMQ